MRARLAAALVWLVACETAPMMQPTAPRAAASPSASAATPPSLRLLRAPAALAEAAGAGELALLASEIGAEGDRVGGFVEPPAEGCLLALARGAEGVEDIDLLAFNDEGSPLAVDEAQDASPALLLCPPFGGRVYLMARVMAGRGLVSVGTQRVPLAAALAVGKAVNARGRPGASGREAESWPGLDEKIALTRRAVGGQWREVRRAALPAEARAPGLLSEPIEAGRCLLILATPSDETSEIDAQLLDGEGRALARASEIGRDRVGVVCSSSPAVASVELRPRIGAGVVAVVIARSEAGSEADIATRVERLDLSATGSPEATMARVTERLKAAGHGAPSTRAQGAARGGQRASLVLPLPTGCARVDVAAGAPLAGLLTELWSEQGQLLDRRDGGASTALFACGGGKVRLEVEAQLRPGPFAVEVRSEELDASVAGVAGARLLSRLNAAGDVVRGASLLSAKRVTLDAQSTQRAEFRAPAGRCLEVGAAVGPGASGVDLRIFGAENREELAHSSGSTASAARVCAGGAPLAIFAEVRLQSGKGDMVLGARTTGPEIAKK